MQNHVCDLIFMMEEVVDTGIYYECYDLLNLNLASAYETNKISVLRMKGKLMIFRHPLRVTYPESYHLVGEN